MSHAPDPRPHVVVLGAGFAGLTFAKKFPEGVARVTLVDRTNHHLFQPLLYQVATAGLAVPDIAQPVRSILASKRDVSVIMDEVTGFDLAGRRVLLGERELAYDHLVVALGGRTSYFGHPEWEKHAPGLKTLDDAIRIRHNVLRAFEAAETATDPQEQRRLATIIVIGGGPTGVELAGTFAELQRTMIARDFRNLKPGMARVILIEGGDRVLGMYPEHLSDKARQQLESLGVNVRLNTRVQAIGHDEVVLADETLHAENVIWAAGVSASPLGTQLGAETDRAGRVKVLPDLSIPGHPEVRVLGDMVALKDPKGQVVPGVSPAAMQMGEYVAENIAEEIRRGITGDPSKRAPFVYNDKGSMATIGRSRAVAKIGKVEFSGYFAWLTWLFVHLVFLVGFRNKISVLFSWVYSYFTFKRGARVVYGAPVEDRG